MATMAMIVRRYLAALEAGDVAALGQLFTRDGYVVSPLLGRMAAREFFQKVVAASAAAALTVHDVLESAEGHRRAVGYFRYDWRLKDGTLVSFECADVFQFELDGWGIESMIICTTPIPFARPSATSTRETGRSSRARREGSRWLDAPPSDPGPPASSRARPRIDLCNPSDAR